MNKYKQMLTYHPHKNEVTLSVFNETLRITVYHEKCELEIRGTICPFDMVVREMQQRCPYDSYIQDDRR